MHGLTASQIVTACEAGRPLEGDARAMALLKAAGGGPAAVSQRGIERSLIALRAATFGPTLEARVTCGCCGARLEIAVRCDAIAADPPTEFDAVCEVCGGSSSCPFDIRDYLWREIVSAADGVLDEVHVLAAAYGWSEDVILGMTAWRRRSYLARLGETETASDEIIERMAPVRPQRDSAIQKEAAAERLAGPPPGEPTPPNHGPTGVRQRDRERATPLPITAPVLPRLAPRWPAPASPRTRSPIRSAPAITSDPVVQVSIGRVEIRSNTARTTTGDRRATRQQPSALGLAEYLQRREEQPR